MNAAADPLLDLMAATARGDHKAFARLYQATSGRLFGLALAILRRRDLAEDTLQEAFTRIWRAAPSYDPSKGAPMGWLSTIVRNRALSALSRRPAESAADDETLAAIPDLAPGPLERALASSDARALGHCLDTLDGDQKNSILLAFYQGLTHPELAAKLGRPIGTVKSWVRRGLLALKECLDRDAA